MCRNFDMAMKIQTEMGNTDTSNTQNEHTVTTSLILEKWDY